MTSHGLHSVIPAKAGRPLVRGHSPPGGGGRPLSRNGMMTKLAANLTMLWNEVDFLDRFAAAAKAGFKGVEYLFPYPYPNGAPRGPSRDAQARPGAAQPARW